MYISRSEIRKVVRELIKETLIKEKWIDFLKGREEKKKIPLATSVEKWFYDYVDLKRGYYMGPNLSSKFSYGIISNPYEDYSIKDINMIEDWNIELAKREGYSREEVEKACGALRDNFYDNFYDKKGNVLFIPKTDNTTF